MFTIIKNHCFTLVLVPRSLVVAVTVLAAAAAAATQAGLTTM